MNVFERDEIGSRSDDSESLDFFPPHYRIGRTKYIIVTGGVMSGVGKGGLHRLPVAPPAAAGLQRHHHENRRFTSTSMPAP